jgi:mevalonate kinase
MNFPAKILLFGEYGILLDSMGLAIPYPRFSGKFSFFASSGGEPAEQEFVSNWELLNLLNCLKGDPYRFHFLDLHRFEGDICSGLHFESNIPQGFGLGSSGALSAAIFARYSAKGQPDDYKSIRASLAAIESIFHGLSSGIDPIISLIGKPVLINNQSSEVKEVDLSLFLNSYSLFLINAHLQGNTKDLVTGFMEQYKMTNFRQFVDGEYIPVVNQTIESLLASDFMKFDTAITKYSELQLNRFTHLIPDEMRKHFNHGICSNDFHLKICGSGGGGFILGIASDRMKAESYFKVNHLDYLIV